MSAILITKAPSPDPLEKFGVLGTDVPLGAPPRGRNSEKIKQLYLYLQMIVSLKILKTFTSAFMSPGNFLKLLLRLQS